MTNLAEGFMLISEQEKSGKVERSISSPQLWISRTKEFRTWQRLVILVDMRG